MYSQRPCSRNFLMSRLHGRGAWLNPLGDEVHGLVGVIDREDADDYLRGHYLIFVRETSTMRCTRALFDGICATPTMNSTSLA